MANIAWPPPADQIAESVDQTCRRNGWEFQITLDTGTDAAWAAEIKVIVRSDREHPDRAHAVYATGGATPDDALARAWGELAAWAGQWEETGHG